MFIGKVWIVDLFDLLLLMLIIWDLIIECVGYLFLGVFIVFRSDFINCLGYGLMCWYIYVFNLEVLVVDWLIE